MEKNTSQTARQGKTLTKISIGLNIVFLLGAATGLIFLAKGDHLSRIYQKITQDRRTGWSYTYNADYGNYTAAYPLYKQQKNIVMLGNSLTAYASWTELLNRPDVANRGIPGDITSGYLGRLKYILSLKPKICFIEGGINDLTNGIPPSTVIKNLRTIVDELQASKIRPVLSTVTLLAERYEGNPRERNKMIKELNKQIYRLAREKNLNLIDLNQYTSGLTCLNPEYSLKDGLHYNDRTYVIWKREIEKVLKLNGI